MPAELSVSISDGLMAKLDTLASDMRRPREELVADALERLVEDEGPWIGRLLRGVREADSGMFVPHDKAVAWTDWLGTANPLPQPLSKRLTF